MGIQRKWQYLYLFMGSLERASTKWTSKVWTNQTPWPVRPLSISQRNCLLLPAARPDGNIYIENAFGGDIARIVAPNYPPVKPSSSRYLPISSIDQQLWQLLPPLRARGILFWKEPPPCARDRRSHTASTEANAWKVALSGRSKEPASRSWPTERSSSTFRHRERRSSRRPWPWHAAWFPGPWKWRSRPIPGWIWGRISGCATTGDPPWTRFWIFVLRLEHGETTDPRGLRARDVFGDGRNGHLPVTDEVEVLTTEVTPIDLGPDIELCDGEIAVLDAGIGYNDYVGTTALRVHFHRLRAVPMPFCHGALRVFGHAHGDGVRRRHWPWN